MATEKTPDSAPDELDESALENVNGGVTTIVFKRGYAPKADGNDFMTDGLSNTLREKESGET